MWWLDPGKEVLNVLFNRVLAPYVENLDLNQVNYGIGQGQLTLHNLRLKKGALDKFRLPVDVVEGHLGKFSLSLHWLNLGNQPVEVLVEDVYLLVVPSSESTYDAEEEERRKQAAKAERLQNAELLHLQGQAEQGQNTPQQQGLISSLMTKIINNLQVTVKNIHIRYEDKFSVPGHPFAAGITLAGFTAVSVNDRWLPAFIDSTASIVHKLAQLESLAVYFDTDTTSLAGLSHQEFVEKFTQLVAHDKQLPNHQFILKPVSGQGRVKMNKMSDKDTPKFDIQLLFDEIGVLLDDHQYRDVISLLDMYHFYIRQHQYHRYRPSIEQFEESRPQALWQFARTAILEEVRERHRCWTWSYFAERRDDRKRYVELFKSKQLGPISPQDQEMLDAFEKKLSYEDLRFYRSIARSQLKKDYAARKKVEDQKKKQQPAQSKGSWGGWLWGSSGSSTNEPTPLDDPAFSGDMTDEQRRELYEVLDYDEKSALAASFEAPRDALKARVVAKLDRGSFALKTDPHGKNAEIVSIVLDRFQTTFVQRPDNFETTLSLTSFAVHDGTTTNTLYPRIIYVQDEKNGVVAPQTQSSQEVVNDEDPFFFLQFENHPLDDRADSALTVRMRNTEVVYHRSYVEAIYKFLKPPASQLESVEALLDVAGQTLEGIRSQTRAGLEFALQTHKTIDVHMDLAAPVIIVPEDITSHTCKHLILDAGHISIGSELANKKAVQEINAKRKQQYSDEDYRKLESLMYDKVTVKLDSTQLLIGDDLDALRAALTSSDHDELHLVERVNIDFLVQNSMVPTAYNLPRFKISGQLPTLQLNFSDTKYKSIMRLIDVAIPKFDSDDAEPPRPLVRKHKSSAFRLPAGYFGTAQEEYSVDDEDEGQRRDVAQLLTPNREADQPSQGSQDEEAETPEIKQHTVEFSFRVDTLRATLYRSSGSGDRELGNVALADFSLLFVMAKYTMAVNVDLKSVNMAIIRSEREPIKLLTSASSNPAEGLLAVRYCRAQPESPVFSTVYKGINQNVDIKIAAVVINAAPEPLIGLYDFVMSTFVPQGNQKPSSLPPTPDQIPIETNEATTTNADDSKINVVLTFAGVQANLINGEVQIATLSLPTASVSVLLYNDTLRVDGRLGSLSITDDSLLRTTDPKFKQILSIEGENFINFRYETFNPEDKQTYTGIKSSVYLAAGSVRLHYLEEPLHELFVFLMQLAKLKGLYDAATEAAVQSVSEIDRMKYEISIQSPVIVFPSDPAHSQDVLTLLLGEFSASNTYEGLLNKTTAALRGIRLSSTIAHDGTSATLKMVDDIDASADIVQASGIDRTQDTERPDTQISVVISDVKLQLTEVQYCLLILLSQSVARVVSSPQGAIAVSSRDSSASHRIQIPLSSGSTDLQPEVIKEPDADGKRLWSTLDAIITLETVKLHLYDRLATTEETLKDHGICRFALNSSTLRTKMLSDGAMEAELVLKSFTMSNTRPGNSKFREIIPAAQHTRNQVMILYTVSGGSDRSSIAVLTVDSPQVIFAIEPVIGLLEFFNSAFDQGSSAGVEDNAEEIDSGNVSSTSSRFNIRLDLHDLSVSILEDDTNIDSRAIRLSIKTISLSYQETVALSVERLGMSLTRMGKDVETVRFLDDIDATFSLDSRASDAHQRTSIELNSQAVVFRASYRDINLITTIVQKAIELYGQSANKPAEEKSVTDRSITSVARRPDTSRRISKRSGSRVHAIGNANVIVSKEEFRCSCDGFRLVLIGDLHEQPMLHLRVKPFILGAKDWSGELQATTTMATHLSYWNLTNSHWEPLIDPWTLNASVSRDKPSGGLLGTLSSKERLDLNISTTFIELALAMYNVLGKEADRVLGKARGSYAPYRIRNRTGLPVHVWSDGDGSASATDISMTEIAHDKTVDWRFDDWRTMREHVSSTGHNSIGLQFTGKQWEQVRSIPVDKEGEYTFSLRPRTGKYSYRVLCEVAVQDNVKVVTLRSTFKVENQTLYPVELVMVNENGQPVGPPEKIAPGQDYPLPIEGFGQNRIKIQPDQGFGYQWSSAIRWEDLITRRELTIRCPHANSNEAAFRFQTFTETDSTDLNAKKYPKLNVKLRAPIELENLLPYNIEYRIYDKDADQNWRSYLRKGGIMPVHSVELSHMVLLNVNVQDTVFKPSDFSIINTDGTADFDVENRVTLRDHKDRKLDLRLNYVRYPNSGGCFKVQIYCPYLVINKTGLPFSVRPWRANRIGTAQDVAGDTRPETTVLPQPFMISHPNAQGRDFSFKVGDSTWTERVGFEAPSAESRLLIPSQAHNNEEIHIGLSWSEGSGKYKLTKVITLSPRFILRNSSRSAIVFREHASVPRGRATLQAGERAPLHFLRMGDDKMLTVAFSGSNPQWSPPFNVEDIGTVHFRLKDPGSYQVQLLSVDIKLGGSTIFIVISDAESYPFVIENDSDYDFTIYQTDVDHPDGPTVNRIVPTYEVGRKASIDYAWDYPASREKKLILNMSGARRAVDVMEIGDLVPFKFSGNRVVSLDVRAESHQQVLRITNYNPQFSLYKPTRRNTSASIAQTESAGSQEAFEAIQEENNFTFAFHVDFEGLGLSLMNHKTVEVVYLTATRLKFEYTASPQVQAINISCGTLQIDNQLHDALFPVVLQPTPVSKDSSTAASLPTVQGSLIWLKDEAHGVTFIKYCSILLQALTVQADEDFLYSVFDLTKIKGAPWDATVEDVLIQQPDEIQEPDGTVGAGDLYFEVLELQPIRLSLSFMRTERVSSEEQLSLRNPFAVVVNAITMAVGNVNEAPLEMNALAIKDMRLTLPDLQGRITYHYSQEVLRQLYRILGSADFIGNPVGLFTNVSSGVADIFYEPFNGAVMHGNQELGIGIAKGAASFVKKTVFGFSDSFTKFTSSVGKGLSAATFDSDYQMQRRMNQRRNRPRHAIYGVTAGAEAFANSLASGVEGVVMKPIEGAESDGARGFFKGIGKGLVGAVTKPVIGVFDLASNVGEGIRNTTTVFDNPARDRVRMPRLVPADGVLVPYSERGAMGQYWMRDLDNGAYRKELYVAHLNLPGGDNVVLLTTNRVISFWSNKLRVEWQIPFTNVQGITIENTGVRFAHKGGKEHDRFVYIPSKSSQTWFFEQVASVVKSFNARRRIDS